jgi:large subunit ribosomal protein L24
MALARIRKGDHVVVVAGRDKGKKGEVLRVLSAESRAIVQGVNVIRRHQKPTPQREGGIIAREAPIHLSNIAVEDPKDGKPTKVGMKKLEDGTWVRFAKRSGEVIATPKGR